MVSGVNGLPGENVIWNVSMVWWMARACAEGIVTALGQCMGGGSVLEFLNMKRSVALQYAQVYVCILFHLLSEQLIWYYGRTLTFNLHSFFFTLSIFIPCRNAFGLRVNLTLVTHRWILMVAYYLWSYAFRMQGWYSDALWIYSLTLWSKSILRT